MWAIAYVLPAQELLGGVRFEADSVTTHSLSMRSRSRAVRLVETRHDRQHSNLIAAREHLDPTAVTDPHREDH